MTMARLLGPYQTPLIVLDTSALVELGQHDLGTISALERLSQELKASGRGEPYEIAVFDDVFGEYVNLLKGGASDDFGMPKASIEVLGSIDMHDAFPESVRRKVDEARELWRKTSPKSPFARDENGRQKAGNHLTANGFPVRVLPSRTDQNILAFAIEQAENGRPCYIVSRDRDLTPPVEKLSTRHPSIHVVGDKVYSPVDISKPAKPLLMRPDLVGELFNMKQKEPFDHYMLTTKVPFAGEEVDMVVSMHPVEGRITAEEGKASRHFLYVWDQDELTGLKGYPAQRLRNQADRELKSAARRLNADYSTFSVIHAVKSRNDGMMRIAQQGKRTVYHNSLKVEQSSSKIEWFTVYDGYLRRLSPETWEHLQRFRAKYSK
ncbi:MAG: NYN domain-containing protein [Candidatus Aenigmarchaeota archaeon]|nr:NYN domain-containing protein [Candidatus Aenigmarchaeota archaeon]